MSKLNPAEVSDRLISFVDLIESRAMASDGPLTPFLDELVSCGAAEKQRFTAILRDLYRIASTKAVVIADTPTPNLNGVGTWRVFEDITRGWWGIEVDGDNDVDPILYPQKINRDHLDRIVSAHNAALATASEGSTDV